MNATMLAFHLIASSAASLSTVMSEGGTNGVGPAAAPAARLPQGPNCMPLASPIHATYGSHALCTLSCREVTPPPMQGLADAKCTGQGDDSTSPLSSSTPMGFVLRQAAGEDEQQTHSSASRDCEAAAMLAADATAAAVAARGKRSRAPDAGDAPGAAWPLWPRKHLALAQPQQQQQKQQMIKHRTHLLGLCDELQVQLSDGSSSSSSSCLAEQHSGSAACSDTQQQLILGGHQQLGQHMMLLLDHQQQHQQLQQLAHGALQLQQQHHYHHHHQQQQQQHALALPHHQQQQQHSLFLPNQHQQHQQIARRRLSVLRRATGAAAATAAPHAALSPPQPLVTPLHAALAWAGSVLSVDSQDVFLFAQHMWSRASGRVDELLMASLGAAQPPSRVALLVTLWVASKLEGNRRRVAGASRLCEVTGLTKWGVTSVEVHLLQLLEFSPYRGW